MTINISLTDNWRILSDKYNYILVKEEYDRTIYEGYFSDLNSLVKHFVNLKVRGFNANSVHNLLISIKSLQDALFKALHPLVDKKLKPYPPSKQNISENE